MDRLEAFLRTELGAHEHDLVAVAAAKLGLTPTEVTRGVRALVDRGEFEEARGPAGEPLLRWRPVVRAKVVSGLEENRLWREFVQPRLTDLPENQRKIFDYGVNEMLNNVIDHSGAREVVVVVRRLPDETEVYIEDDGIGIFTKLQRERGLENPRHVALELSKGKLTTDPENHTGEGIFFTSRMCDKFLIWSGATTCGHVSREKWMVVDAAPRNGTTVRMVVAMTSKLEPSAVFDEFAPPDREAGFSRTSVLVALLRQDGEGLLSRSQAKRLMARCELFQEVTLDFTGVDAIGPAFADEIFRVFAAKNPAVALHAINDGPGVRRMIERARAGLDR